MQPKTILIWLTGFLLAFFMGIRLFNEGVPGWKHIVTSDGRGYYAYLPAFILDWDPTFAGVLKRESELLGIPGYQAGYLVDHGDRKVNKYFAGEALLLLPFFLAGLLISWFTGMPLDGYSIFFQLLAGLGALFYMVAGLWFLARILRGMGFRDDVSALTILLLLLGTNLFHYTLWQPTMSHVFSFFAVNGFLLQVQLAMKNWDVRRGMAAGFFFGITLLLRPTNGVILLLIPFFAGNLQAMKPIFSWKKSARPAAWFFIVALLILAVQPAAWLAQTGKPLLWSYSNEGFRFAEPAIGEVLWGFRKGLFIYTPLIAISLTGFFFILRKGWMKPAFLVLFLAVATWIIASWWCWYYGDSFGMRAFIDYYGVFAILLAFLLQAVPGRFGAKILALLLTPLVLLNFIQQWQYNHRVMHRHSMNREKYCHIFMKADPALTDVLGGNDEIATFSTDLSHPVLGLYHDMERPSPGWQQNLSVVTGKARSGRMAGCLDSLHQFSTGVAVKVKELGTTPGSWYITGEVFVRDSLPGASNRTLVVVSMDSISPGENWWQGFQLNDIPVENVGSWSRRTFRLMTPVIGNPNSILKIYLWNTGKKPLLMDDFNVKIFGQKR